MSGLTKKRISDLEIERSKLQRQLDNRPSLRDQFAMAALLGCMQRYGSFVPAVVAEDAYAIADAMIRYRVYERDALGGFGDRDGVD